MIFIYYLQRKRTKIFLHYLNFYSENAFTYLWSFKKQIARI